MIVRRLLILSYIVAFGITPAAFAQSIRMSYEPAPIDNPLKGLVPYAGQGGTFPHSMEFWYFPLDELMIGEDSFNWSPIERRIDAISSRACQTVMRVYLEYPGKNSALPKFLSDQGVKLTSYQHDGQMNHTPDYDDPRMRKAMQSFIAAYGKKYDGDPRIGFITMGLLGHWGEWHTYPRSELFASEEVQAEVMDAFESAFKKTKVLMRYPAGPNAWQKAPNHKRQFGYHDDSFAWATLETGREEDSWFFQALMRAAGPQAISKWKTEPIGGEIRPEVWGCVFDNPSCAPSGQEFESCVKQTHVSWLMDSGMFTQPKSAVDDQRRNRATEQIQKMGYELFVSAAEITQSKDQLFVRLDVNNRGVAPFYYDWPVTLIVADSRSNVLNSQIAPWRLTQVLPGETSRWHTEIDLLPGTQNPKVMIRVKNPMAGGKPFRFANQEQAQNGNLSIK